MWSAVAVVVVAGVVGAQPDPAPGTGPAAASESPSRREAFRPSVHGFRFRNSFTGSPVPARYRGLVSRLGLDSAIDTPVNYGLCGGMSASAADFYLADREPPGRRTPPAEPDELYEYLSARQVDSLGPGFIFALKFAEWMAYDDHGATPSRAGGGIDIAEETARQLPAIYDKLDNHDLVVLGLVHVKAGSGLLWENHQVLAYGYDRDEQGATIRVYDPNHPGDDGAVVTVRPYEPGGEAVRCELVPSRGRARPVRGLFEMPYTPRTPAESLSR